MNETEWRKHNEGKNPRTWWERESGNLLLESHHDGIWRVWCNGESVAGGKAVNASQGKSAADNFVAVLSKHGRNKLEAVW